MFRLPTGHFKPISTYLMCVSTDRHAEGSCQAKVSKLDLTLGIDEEVLWLQVSMKDSVRVAEGQALQQLEQVTLQTQDTMNENTGESSYR